MSTKLALVVDDSKSARQVLRRMLEKYNISVDATESATDALDYLKRHRPDVIFMDHMMPGMDGFEAIKQIKANPKTVTIPVMMYTSKGGDLYLGEARALGAVGILPKTVAPAELYDALLRLGLAEDRRSDELTALDEDSASERATDVRNSGTDSWALIEEPLATRTGSPQTDDEKLRRLLEEQRVELRKDLLVSIESVSRNVSNKLNQDMNEKVDRLTSSLPKPPPLLLPAALLSLPFLLVLGSNHTLKKEVAQLNKNVTAQHVVPAQGGDTGMTQLQPSGATLQDAGNTQQDSAEKQPGDIAQYALDHSFDYPFNELALDNGRLDGIQDLIDQLQESGFRGLVTLETHVGVFCMNGNTQDGFNLATADQPVKLCDYIGNPVQPTDRPSAHQSLRFANFLSELETNDDIFVEVVALPRTSALSPYPVMKDTTRAGEWNEAARRNNRVLVHLEPR